MFLTWDRNRVSTRSFPTLGSPIDSCSYNKRRLFLEESTIQCEATSILGGSNSVKSNALTLQRCASDAPIEDFVVSLQRTSCNFNVVFDRQSLAFSNDNQI